MVAAARSFTPSELERVRAEGVVIRQLEQWRVPQGSPAWIEGAERVWTSWWVITSRYA